MRNVFIDRARHNAADVIGFEDAGGNGHAGAFEGWGLVQPGMCVPPLRRLNFRWNPRPHPCAVTNIEIGARPAIIHLKNDVYFIEK
jgi:hypothetical protein